MLISRVNVNEKLMYVYVVLIFFDRLMLHPERDLARVRVSVWV